MAVRPYFSMFKMGAQGVGAGIFYHATTIKSDNNNCYSIEFCITMRYYRAGIERHDCALTVGRGQYSGYDLRRGARRDSSPGRTPRPLCLAAPLSGSASIDRAPTRSTRWSGADHHADVRPMREADRHRGGSYPCQACFQVEDRASRPPTAAGCLDTAPVQLLRRLVGTKSGQSSSAGRSARRTHRPTAAPRRCPSGRPLPPPCR